MPTIKCYYQCFHALFSHLSSWEHNCHLRPQCFCLLIHFTSCLMPVSVFFKSSTWTAAVWEINPTAAVQPKGGPCFHLKSVGCFFKRARQRGGRTASEGMRSLFKARMNQLFCEHMHKTQVISQLFCKWALGSVHLKKKKASVTCKSKNVFWGLES